MASITPTIGSRAIYDIAEVEQKWQAIWDECRVTEVPVSREEARDTYVFVTPPFTSGDAHMGHVRSYTIGDAYARYRRHCGDSVLFSLGFDAFGLPSEIGAAQHNMTPEEWVARCCERMRSQFERLGLSFDWGRMFVSSDPSIYQWSQWLFIKLFEAGLVYQREGQVEWCDSCRTVLANLQVENGCCWRCHNPVRLVNRKQWYLRRSAYNEENYRLLSRLERWNKHAIIAQQTTLGRVEGVELVAHGFDGSELTVFTPFADSIQEAAFVLLSPNHPDIGCWVSDVAVGEQLEALQLDGLQRLDRKAGKMPVIDTGASVQVATVPHPLPVLISQTVDVRFGPTCVLGIPSRDEIDDSIAEQITRGSLSITWRNADRQSTVRQTARYRASDFVISRQRSWGAPIPIIDCETCGAVPVPISELPVRLPEDLQFNGADNALERHPSFSNCTCPFCGGEASRETDTLDCHIDAAWTELPLAVPPADRERALFSHPDLGRWLPVVQLVHGADTGGFILNMRLVAKALRDADVLRCLPGGEPFDGALMHEMVQLDGRKMSKHLGNTVVPQELVTDVGADAVRFAILHAAAPAKAFSWNDQALRYAVRFLKEFWEFSAPRLMAHEENESGDPGETTAKDRLRLTFWCDTAIRKVTENLEELDMHQVTRNVVRFFERIREFESRIRTKRGDLSSVDRQAVVTALNSLIRLLSPIAPHIAEELWQLGGSPGLACRADWPVPSRAS